MMDVESLQYPIGRMSIPEIISEKDIQEWVIDLETVPQQLYEVLQNVSEEQLQLTYRPGAWTIQQLVHHLADAHMNSFIRIKLALTENVPTVKPFDENLWVLTPDSKTCSYEYGLKLLEGVHYRMVHLIKNLTRDELNKTYYHPDSQKNITIKETLGIYAWHARHHLAHIKLALNQSVR